MIKDRINNFMVHNTGVNKTDIPSEMVNANGSGLNPHISMEGTKIKIKTIAKIRNISKANLKELVEENTGWALLNLIGQGKINVLNYILPFLIQRDKQDKLSNKK